MVRGQFAVLIFCDLRGSSEVANELSPEEYANNYIRSFYYAADLSKLFLIDASSDTDAPWSLDDDKNKRNKWGDEVFLYRSIKNIDNCKDDVFNALSFAYTLKLFWLLSPYSFNKVVDELPPRELSCGIHIGRIHKIEGTDLIASYDINLAKRVEGISRKGISSNIFATHLVAETFNRWRGEQIQENYKNMKLLCTAGFDPSVPQTLQGIAGNVYVSELVPKLTDKPITESKSIIKNLPNMNEQWDIHKIISTFIDIIFHNHSKFGDSKHLEDAEDVIKYIDNLIYFSRTSGNIWFRFNVFYIIIALTHKYSLNDLFNKQIKDMYKYFKTSI